MRTVKDSWLIQQIKTDTNDTDEEALFPEFVTQDLWVRDFLIFERAR